MLRQMSDDKWQIDGLSKLSNLIFNFVPCLYVYDSRLAWKNKYLTVYISVLFHDVTGAAPAPCLASFSIWLYSFPNPGQTPVGATEYEATSNSRE